MIVDSDEDSNRGNEDMPGLASVGASDDENSDEDQDIEEWEESAEEELSKH